MKSTGCIVLRMSGVFIVMAMMASHCVHAQVPAQISVCGDTLDRPPFLYYQRSNGQLSSRTIGYTVDYLDMILQGNQRRFTLQRMPWARCQAKVQAGEIDMLVDASDSPERSNQFLVSPAYYRTTGIYLYNRKLAPPQMNRLDDLKKLRVCGQHGFSYIAFGLHPEQIDTGTYSLEPTLAKLRAGRCDVVLNEEEILLGLTMLGAVDYRQHPDFAYKLVPGMQGPGFHMMVTQQRPYSQALLRMLSEGITETRSQHLRKQHLRMPSLPST